MSLNPEEHVQLYYILLISELKLIVLNEINILKFIIL